MSLRAHTIIQKFGGTRELARKLSKAPSTVQSWKDAGRIRDTYEDEILAAAAEHGIPIEPSDYVQPKAHFAGRDGAEISHDPESDSAVTAPHQEKPTEIPQEETAGRGSAGDTRRRFPGEAGVL